MGFRVEIFMMSALGHVWTAPWQELSNVAAALVGCGHVSGLFVRRLCVDGAFARSFLRYCSIGRVRSCGRPVCAAVKPLAIMLFADRVPIVNTHSKMRRPKRVLPIPGSTLSALRHHVLANSFKTSNAVAVAWPHLLESLWLRCNQSIALRCRRAGAVHSIISGHSARFERCPLPPRKRTFVRTSLMPAKGQKQIPSYRSLAARRCECMDTHANVLRSTPCRGGSR